MQMRTCMHATYKRLTMFRRASYSMQYTSPAQFCELWSTQKVNVTGLYSVKKYIEVY